MIRSCTKSDFETIHEIINDGAKFYRRSIPENLWHEPYMDPDELADEIDNGVVFWSAEEQGRLVAVIGV